MVDRSFRIKIGIAVTIVFGICLPSCIPTLVRNSFRQDQTQLTFVIASLFNQRHGPWHGDWVLRRERLQIIDRELVSTQPDIVLLQETLAKSSSAYDSDQKTLQAGALADFHWSNSLVHYYSDTDEEESMTLAVRQSTLGEQPPPPPQQFSIGQDGVLVLNSIYFRDQAPLAIANLYLPHTVQSKPDTYEQLANRIATFLQKEQICPDRFALGGWIDNANQKEFLNFLERFDLRTITDGSCEGRDCASPSTENPFFASRVSERSQRGAMHLFVPHSTRVTDANTILASPRESTLFAGKYSLRQLWPTADLGWMLRIRFAPCS